MKKFFNKKTLNVLGMESINFNEKLKVTLESKEEIISSGIEFSKDELKYNKKI